MIHMPNGSTGSHVNPQQHSSSLYEWKVKPAKKSTNYTAFGKWVKIVGPPHSCKRPTTVPKDIFVGSVWQCDECDTKWVYEGAKAGSVTWDYTFRKDEAKTKNNEVAYCVMCKASVRMSNYNVKTSDSGRRMAQGTCANCGTKVNRILGTDS